MKNRKLLSICAIAFCGLALVSCQKNTSNSSSSTEEYTKTEYTDGLVFELNEAKDGYVVTDYLSIEYEVIIPELYSGLPVREIGDECFQYDHIVDIELPR